MADDTITVVRELHGRFDSLAVDVLTVRVVVGPPWSGITLSGEPKVLEQLRTEIRGDVLEIAPIDTANYSTQRPLYLEFSVPELQTVMARMGAQVTLEGFTGGALRLAAQSGALIRASGKADQVWAHAESGATVELGSLHSRHVSSQSSSGGRIV